jgi:hypothetical protein
MEQPRLSAEFTEEDAILDPKKLASTESKHSLPLISDAEPVRLMIPNDCSS